METEAMVVEMMMSMEMAAAVDGIGDGDCKGELDETLGLFSQKDFLLLI